VLYDVPFLELVPDWLCEVLSIHTYELDREHKLPAYARHGVPHVWVIDPTAERWRSGHKACSHNMLRAMQSFGPSHSSQWSSISRSSGLSCLRLNLRKVNGSPALSRRPSPSWAP
jgi:hypothetical protein